MSTRVDLSTEVVKQLRDYPGSHPDVALADRIQWVLEHRKEQVKNASQWGLKANLTRQHVHTILARLRLDPQAGQEVATLHALATAARVSPPWFVHGTGSPDSTWDAPGDRYPALARVLASQADPARWSAPAIAAAQSMMLDADHDPGEAWWTETLDRLDVAIKVSTPKLPSRGPDPLAGIDERPVRTARKKK